MISRMEWAAGRKLRANAGETLTEVLISVLVIALGMTLFLSAFLASGRMLQQGEEQVAGYYDSRNQLENNRTAEQASGRYVLELEASGTGGMKKSAWRQMPTRQAYRRITGRDSIRSYCM